MMIAEFEFTYLYAVCIVGSIFTYIVDLILGKLLKHISFYLFITLLRCNLIHFIFEIFQTLTLFVSDIIVAITYLFDAIYHNDVDGYWYCFATISLVLLPTIAVQIFSIRWHQMDNNANGHSMTKILWTIHITLLGVVHR